MRKPEPLVPSTKLSYKFDFNNSWFVCIGSNGSGKTTLVRFLLRKVPKSKLVILNGGGENDWFLTAERANVITPPTYDIAWLHKKMLEIVTTPEYSNMMMVIDDADNWPIKHSEILKSVFINQRRLDVGGVIISRRLNWIPIEIFDKAKYCFFGRQNSDRTVWYIAEVIGMTLAKKLKTLQQFEFLAYENATGNWEIIKAPKV